MAAHDLRLDPGSEAPVLFRRFPALLEHVPHIPLGRYPTPLEIVSVEDAASRRRDVFVKRDDLTAEPYGGNKVRKLEFLLADARRRGAGVLITAGATGSHHALATAVYGRALGFRVALVLFPQHSTPHVRRTLLMDHGLGAELRFTRRMEMVPLAVARARMMYWKDRPYIIPPGGSDALGSLGYVNAGLELAEQLSAARARPSRIHVAAGTLGTVAGLALGLALAGIDIPIVAARITGRIVANEHALRSLAASTGALLAAAGIRAPVERALGMIELRHEWIGAGYGRETDAGRAATAAFARAGLTLDPTYTAKSAAALLAEPAGDAPPLLLHTLSAVEPTGFAHDVRPETLPPPFARYLARE